MSRHKAYKHLQSSVYTHTALGYNRVKCLPLVGFEEHWQRYSAQLGNPGERSGGKLHALLRNNKSGAPPTIVCCGHSLGGATATLCSEWIKRTFADIRPRVFCVTFGSPRVGCKHFLSHYHHLVPLQNHFRVEQEGDPITMVPSGILTQYRHVGQKVSSCKVQTASGPCGQVRLHHGTEQPGDVHLGTSLVEPCGDCTIMT